MLASETVQNRLLWGRVVRGEQLCCRPTQSVIYIFISNQHTKVNSKSLLWAGKHILHPFYPYSFLPPHGRDGNAATCWRETIVHLRLCTVGVSLPTPWYPSHGDSWVSSKPLSEMTFCYPLLGEKNQKRKLINFVVLVFVKNKLFLLFSAKPHSFQQPSHISVKQCIGQALNSNFWGKQVRNCPFNSLKMSPNRFLSSGSYKLIHSNKQSIPWKSPFQGKW